MKNKKVKFTLPKPPNFKDGVLCFCLLRRYKGKGPIKLLLHEATPHSDGFGYGAGRCWVVSKWEAGK